VWAFSAQQRSTHPNYFTEEYIFSLLLPDSGLESCFGKSDFSCGRGSWENHSSGCSRKSKSEHACTIAPAPILSFNQGSGFRKVLGDHRCSQSKQLHGVFALLQPDILKLVSQYVLENFKALPKLEIARRFLLLPEMVSNRFVERLAQRGRGRTGISKHPFRRAIQELRDLARRQNLGEEHYLFGSHATPTSRRS
jgi:hypothetical protein